MGKQHGFVRGVATCALCGKVCYLTRADAKKAARTVNPSEHFSPYTCNGMWHFGKLSPTIARGYSSRDGSREYPPAVTREPDIAAVQRRTRRRTRSRKQDES